MNNLFLLIAYMFLYCSCTSNSENVRVEIDTLQVHNLDSIIYLISPKQFKKCAIIYKYSSEGSQIKGSYEQDSTLTKLTVHHLSEYGITNEVYRFNNYIIYSYEEKIIVYKKPIYQTDKTKSAVVIHNTLDIKKDHIEKWVHTYDILEDSDLINIVKHKFIMTNKNNIVDSEKYDSAFSAISNKLNKYNKDLEQKGIQCEND